MTNLEAYQATYKNPNGEASASLSLTINSIDPDLSDMNELSVGYAIFDKITASDYSQGDTSEKLSDSARSILLNQANTIFGKYEVVNPFLNQSPEISGKQW